MRTLLSLVLAVALLGAGAGPAAAQPLPTLDVVIGNNFGHLPMFVGVDRGLFKQHGVDVRLKVVSTGSDMVRDHPQYFSDLPPLPAGAR